MKNQSKKMFKNQKISKNKRNRHKNICVVCLGSGHNGNNCNARFDEYNWSTDVKILVSQLKETMKEDVEDEKHWEKLMWIAVGVAKKKSKIKDQELCRNFSDFCRLIAFLDQYAIQWKFDMEFFSWCPIICLAELHPMMFFELLKKLWGEQHVEEVTGMIRERFKLKTEQEDTLFKSGKKTRGHDLCQGMIKSLVRENEEIRSQNKELWCRVNLMTEKISFIGKSQREFADLFGRGIREIRADVDRLKNPVNLEKRRRYYGKLNPKIKKSVQKVIQDMVDDYRQEGGEDHQDDKYQGQESTGIDLKLINAYGKIYSDQDEDDISEIQGSQDGHGATEYLEKNVINTYGENYSDQDEDNISEIQGSQDGHGATEYLEKNINEVNWKKMRLGTLEKSANFQKTKESQDDFKKFFTKTQNIVQTSKTDI